MISERLLAEILMLRGLGYSQGEIADKVGLSQSSVCYHLSEINQKAGEKGDVATFIGILVDGFLPEVIQNIKVFEKLVK